jgi:hypothetical protein
MEYAAPLGKKPSYQQVHLSTTIYPTHENVVPMSMATMSWRLCPEYASQFLEVRRPMVVVCREAEAESYLLS